jgi:hypothetical protein
MIASSPDDSGSGLFNAALAKPDSFGPNPYTRFVKKPFAVSGEKSVKGHEARDEGQPEELCVAHRLPRKPDFDPFRRHDLAKPVAGTLICEDKFAIHPQVLTFCLHFGPPLKRVNRQYRC